MITWEASSFSDSLTYKYYRLHGHKYVVFVSRYWRKFVEAWTGSTVGSFLTRKYRRITEWLTDKLFKGLEDFIRWEAKPIEETFMFGYYNRYGRKVKRSASRYWDKVLTSQAGSFSASLAYRSYRRYRWILASIWDTYRFAILTVCIAIVAGAIIVMLSSTFKINRDSYQDNISPSEEYHELVIPESSIADNPDNSSSVQK